MVDAVEAQRHHVTAPLAGRAARTAAGGDATSVEGDGNVEGRAGAVLLGHRMGGHYGPTQVKSCRVKNQDKFINYTLYLKQLYDFLLANAKRFTCPKCT